MAGHGASVLPNRSMKFKIELFLFLYSIGGLAESKQIWENSVVGKINLYLKGQIRTYDISYHNSVIL